MKFIDADELLIKKVLFDFKDSFFDKTISQTQLDLLVEKFSKYAIFRVLKKDSEIEGFYSLYANNLQTKIAFLSMIVVKKNKQGRGCGKLLLTDCIEISKKQRMNYLQLEVNKNNEIAIIFYKKNGFNIIGENEKSFYLERKL